MYRIQYIGMILIITLISIGLTLTPDDEISNTTNTKHNTSIYTLKSILDISVKKIPHDYIYPTKPPIDLYNIITYEVNTTLASIEKEIDRLPEDAVPVIGGRTYLVIEDPALEAPIHVAIHDKLTRAKSALTSSSADTWTGFLHLETAIIESKTAEAYIKLYNKDLDRVLVAKLYNATLDELMDTISSIRYTGGSLEDAVATWYPVERHLKAAYYILQSAGRLLETGPKAGDNTARQAEVPNLAEAYGAIHWAQLHINIAKYLIKHNLESNILYIDYTIDVHKASKSIISLVGNYIATYGQGGSASSEASRFLSRAKEMQSIGLHAYALVDALQAYLLASMETELGPLREAQEPWRIGLHEVYDAKLNAVEALTRYSLDEVRGTIKGLLLYRFYSYIKSGDELVGFLVEKSRLDPGILDNIEQSAILKEAYIAYAEAAYALNNIDDAIHSIVNKYLRY